VGGEKVAGDDSGSCRRTSKARRIESGLRPMSTAYDQERPNETRKQVGEKIYR